jgi:hypothetical protein
LIIRRELQEEHKTRRLATIHRNAYRKAGGVHETGMPGVVGKMRKNAGLSVV